MTAAAVREWWLVRRIWLAVVVEKYIEREVKQVVIRRRRLKAEMDERRRRGTLLRVSRPPGNASCQVMLGGGTRRMGMGLLLLNGSRRSGQ